MPVILQESWWQIRPVSDRGRGVHYMHALNELLSPIEFSIATTYIGKAVANNNWLSQMYGHVMLDMDNLCHPCTTALSDMEMPYMLTSSANQRFVRFNKDQKDGFTVCSQVLYQTN